MENETVDIVRYLVVNKGISIAGEKDVTPGMLMRNLDKVLRLMPDATMATYAAAAAAAPNHVNDHHRPEWLPSNIPEEEPDVTTPPVTPSAPIQEQQQIEPRGQSRSLSEEARDYGATTMNRRTHRGDPSHYGGTGNNDGCFGVSDDTTDAGTITTLVGEDEFGTTPIMLDDGRILRETSTSTSAAATTTTTTTTTTSNSTSTTEVEECIICFDGKIDCVATPCGHQMCCLRCSKNISRCPVCAQDCSFLRVFKP